MTARSERLARRRAVRAAAILASTIALWLLLDGVPAAARAWLVLLLVLLPAAVTAQTRLIGDPGRLERIPIYASSAVSLWLLALATLLVAHVGGFSLHQLGFVALPALTLLAWAAPITVAAIASLFVARALRVPESAMLRRLIPDTLAERTAFAALSLTAGTCEEFVFRGFVLQSLTDAWSFPLLAVLASSVVFGWLHAYQNAGGAIRAAFLGVLLCIPTVLTGSIVPSMIAHSAVDLIAGLVLAKSLVPDLA